MTLSVQRYTLELILAKVINSNGMSPNYTYGGLWFLRVHRPCHACSSDFIFEIALMFDKTACVKVLSILLLAHQL